MEINQIDFPSTVQKSIWHCAVFLAPFRDVTPKNYMGSTDTLVEGERNLYDFMTEFYADMYRNPEAYHLPINEYDRYMKDKDVDNLTSYEKQKEGNLRNRFQRPIQFYQKLLYEIGISGEPGKRDRLRVDSSLFSEMINRNNLRIMRGEHRKIIESLSRLGLHISVEGNQASVKCCEYPHMLEALQALSRSGSKKYRLTNFLRVDFRGLDGYRPGFNDIVSIIGEDFRGKAVEMDRYMETLGCSSTVQPLKNTTLGSVWKMAYKRGKSVYGFQADTDWMESYVYFNSPQNISKMGYLLREKSELLYEWFNSHFPVMECACRYNRRVDIGGVKKLLCGFSNRMIVTNPTSKDVQNMKKTIQLFRNSRTRKSV